MNNIHKKIITLLISLAICFSLSSCQNLSVPNDDLITIGLKKQLQLSSQSFTLLFNESEILDPEIKQIIVFDKKVITANNHDFYKVTGQLDFIPSIGGKSIISPFSLTLDFDKDINEWKLVRYLNNKESISAKPNTYVLNYEK